MTYLLIALGAILLAGVLLQRATVLAPFRLGWLFYLSNIAGDFVPKRVGISRAVAEGGAAAAGLLLLWAGGAPLSAVALAAAALVALQAAVWRRELVIIGGTTNWVQRVGAMSGKARGESGKPTRLPSPSTQPALTVTLSGPFVRRTPRLQLGRLVVGRKLTLVVVVGNHTEVPTQLAPRLDVRLPVCLKMTADFDATLPRLKPGQVVEIPVALEVTTACGAAVIRLEVSWGDRSWSRSIAIECAVERAKVVSAGITRYPGARRSSFAWRGDMDLYDTSTFQSVEGLEVAFGLSARYAIPQTMYLSTRLSLDERAAREYAEHYGVDRGAADIPRFIAWMREKVELRHRCSYPTRSACPYVIELGNHGHIHFGTDAVAAPENGWNLRAKLGAGDYPWVGPDKTTFGEQRDNALEARRWCEKLFDYSPKSWAMPDRTRDETTPAAMEAAGCEVLSDSDVRTIDNVLYQPPPHFAPGSGAVELTKRYPGDPHDLLHYGMNLFWIHRAHRLGIPVVFMCHQHMTQFDGLACTRLTEAVLRHVLHSFEGDLWIDTVYGIGVYWRDVLSEKRVIDVEVRDGKVRASNRGKLRHDGIPVDLRLEGGGGATVLVDLDPGATVELDAKGAG